MGLRILQLCAPYLPHITETLYHQIYYEKIDKNIRASSIHLTLFTDIQTLHSFPEALQSSLLLLKIIAAIRRMKKAKQLSLKTPLSSLILHSVKQESLKALVCHEQLLKGITQAEIITYTTGDLPESILVLTNNLWSAALDLDHLDSPVESPEKPSVSV